jgi:site-specific recombinase XerD
MDEIHVSIDQAARSWLGACTHVREVTRTSYAGEVRRFREYLEDAGIFDAHAITEHAWLDYLSNLTEARSTVSSKRMDALKISSALQAARITRSFLRHCWIQRWLKWVPGLGNQRCNTAQAASTFRVPKGLVSFLLDPGEFDIEVMSRSRCIVGLTFWGGFRPKEIAELQGRDLVLDDHSGAMLHPNWRTESVALPSIMVQQLKHYMALRIANYGPLTSDVALIVKLKSTTPLSASAVWGVLKDWIAAQAPIDTPLSTTVIRESFKQLAGEEASDYIRVIERQSASRHRLVINSTNRIVSAQQVTEELLKKMVEFVPNP